MGTCGQPGYVFWDLCLKQGICICLNQGIGLSIFYCPRKDILFKTGYLKQGRKISEICLKQGQGMRGWAAPPHPRIYNSGGFIINHQPSTINHLKNAILEYSNSLSNQGYDLSQGILTWLQYA